MHMKVGGGLDEEEINMGRAARVVREEFRHASARHRCKMRVRTCARALAGAEADVAAPAALEGGGEGGGDEKPRLRGTATRKHPSGARAPCGPRCVRAMDFVRCRQEEE